MPLFQPVFRPSLLVFFDGYIPVKILADIEITKELLYFYKIMKLGIQLLGRISSNGFYNFYWAFKHSNEH